METSRAPARRGARRLHASSTRPALPRLSPIAALPWTEADIAFCQQYFRDEDRDPTITEIRVIDTYWSDHCRHTTFGTVAGRRDDRRRRGAARPSTATWRCATSSAATPSPCASWTWAPSARKLRSRRKGVLTDVDESDEINACTVKVKVDVDGEEQDWLFLFKNETHNHPTEIEPFGGAATCLGGAIRDPLSGRSYVYQAMRVTGAADPAVPVCRDAARQAAAAQARDRPPRPATRSYGNQIGLATGQVSELYHPGYAAKRMEIGAVVGAAPADNVRARDARARRRGGPAGRPHRPRRHAAAPPAPPRPTTCRVHRDLRRRGAEGQPARGAQAAAPVPPRRRVPAHQALQRLRRRRRERGRGRAAPTACTSNLDARAQEVRGPGRHRARHLREPGAHGRGAGRRGRRGQFMRLRRTRRTSRPRWWPTVTDRAARAHDVATATPSST